MEINKKTKKNKNYNFFLEQNNLPLLKILKNFNIIENKFNTI